MSRIELCICVGIAGGIFFAAAAVLRSMSREEIYRQRLRMVEENPGQERKSTGWQIKDLAAAIVPKVSRIFAARRYADRIQSELIAAGIPLKGEEYICISGALILILPVIIFMLTRNIGLSFIAIVGGMIIPRIYLNHKKTMRIQTINQQLGDSLGVMANALRAGFGFQQAMDTVKKEMPPPISSEFSWALREMNLGVSQEEALTNMGKRVRSDDLDMVITGIIIQRQVGGNLAEILENISITIRERTKIKREIRILTAQGRLSGLIIGLMPVFLIAAMMVINAGYFSVMIRDYRGVSMLGAACVLELLGAMVIKKIIKIEL